MSRGFAIILIFFSGLCTGQEINSIQFSGLKKTKKEYLLQFLQSKIGSMLDSSRLVIDGQTLTNLEMFSNVDVLVKKNGLGVQVVFECEELFTLLPIFSFGGIEENFWIQAGASEANLHGQGNKVLAYYQYYDRSSVVTHLTFDRIHQSLWGLNINLVKWSTVEPLYFSSPSLESEEVRVDYQYDNYTFGTYGIYHLNVRDKIELGGAYFTEYYSKIGAGEITAAPSEVTTRKVLGKVIYFRDRINYHYFYLDGAHIQWSMETVQSMDGDPAFYISFVDLKHFVRYGNKGNFASRLRLGLSTNEESPFAPFVLDSFLNIRGAGNRVDRGTGTIVLNFEYRYAVLDEDRYAIQVVGFSDTGSWRNPGGDFSDFKDSDNFVLFGGAGIRLIHKKFYNAIFRIDYGFNLQDTEISGFVLGIGQYF